MASKPQQAPDVDDTPTDAVVPPQDEPQGAQAPEDDAKGTDAPDAPEAGPWGNGGPLS